MCTLIDCTSYPYKLSVKKERMYNLYGLDFMDEYNFPVLARTNGRPRVCRNLNYNFNQKISIKIDFYLFKNKTSLNYYE